ncbi:MAG: ribonuclease P protein component [Candidatus Shikimatogenerans bostrichidophilus]|nr:MAG: ribonuclease P protein component [Candidatus Shikimatogenerans bostrichidophilus]
MFLNKKEINILLKQGKILFYKKNKIIFNYINNYKNKIIIKIPKKNIKKSVDRNKIKRRIYNSYKLNEYLLSNKKKYLIFFFLLF